MHLLVPRSSSSAKVKVKYQSYLSQKMAVLGGISVSQTHLVLYKEPVARQQIKQYHVSFRKKFLKLT